MNEIELSARWLRDHVRSTQDRCPSCHGTRDHHPCDNPFHTDPAAEYDRHVGIVLAALEYRTGLLQMKVRECAAMTVRLQEASAAGNARAARRWWGRQAS